LRCQLPKLHRAASLTDNQFVRDLLLAVLASAKLEREKAGVQPAPKASGIFEFYADGDLQELSMGCWLTGFSVTSGEVTLVGAVHTP